MGSDRASHEYYIQAAAMVGKAEKARDQAIKARKESQMAVGRARWLMRQPFRLPDAMPLGEHQL
jgi:hypothetical protein